MLQYPHFAVPNLYLQNGYKVIQTPEGEARTYSAESRLEHCVRRVLLRKPTRLRGWDLRFLRRGMELSQVQLGKLLGRDAQTIARWEKSRRNIPTLSDLAVRCRFAEKFEPGMTVRELTSFVDRTAPKLPNLILLTFDGVDWSFSFRPLFSYLHKDLVARNTLVLPSGPGATQVVYITHATGSGVWQKSTGAHGHRTGGLTIWEQTALEPSIEEPRSLIAATPMLEYKITGSANERSSETKH